MTVNELIQELQKIPEDMRDLSVMCYAGHNTVKEMEVTFKESSVLHSSGWSYKVIKMEGDY